MRDDDHRGRRSGQRGLVRRLRSPFSKKSAAGAGITGQLKSVTISGTIQSKLGCPGDWQPDCDPTSLSYSPHEHVWTGEFDLPAGNYEYKVVINNSWDENYGRDSIRNGSNISLALKVPTRVKFLYDPQTHWVTDNVNTVIATVIGNFQTQLGCSKNNDPACLLGWLKDPEGTGIYWLSSHKIKPGHYQMKVATNLGLSETFGIDGAPDGPALKFNVPKGSVMYFGFDPQTKRPLVGSDGAPRGNLFKFRAYWVRRDMLLWGRTGDPTFTYTLHYDPQGAMRLDLGKIRGGEELSLTYAPGSPPPEVVQKFPHLANRSILRLRPEDQALIPAILKGQIAVTVRDGRGTLVDATSVQIPGVIDDLFTYQGRLGVSFEDGAPFLRLWAPTARSVKLHLFADSNPASKSTVVAMAYNSETGVWTGVGTPEWKGYYYLYEVEGYFPPSQRIVKSLVTDPYSISLSTNSTRSQIVDLNDPALMPAGWAELAKPQLDASEDSVIYELHGRDFSISDLTVPEAERGTYKAFTHRDSNGMKHLAALARAGLTHIQLLPVFDFTTVNEDRRQRQEPDQNLLKGFPPDSAQQQKIVMQFRSRDGFNWGYDPFHFSTPEGSYSTDSNGPTRILEFREMVAALNHTGLRVVMDVVYTHTHSSGLADKSVLDRIVPMYYYRLNGDGAVENSTCCSNTASEHAMMEKLMIDSLVIWATAYKVDGFRFDLMAHHMLHNLTQTRAVLDNLTPGRDGVDGKRIILFGEGWDFGEVANNARGLNGSQLNIAGTGIGVFNDRMRDGGRGGSAFGNVLEQGFATGLYSYPNAAYQGSPEDQKYQLLKCADWIRVGLAGNLKEYVLVNQAGQAQPAGMIDYNGRPAGYTRSPQENVNYISAHDNETLFDIIQIKASVQASMAERVGMSILASSLVMFGQGIPFFHAGDDLLRSKSLDRNSYDSGDWFNRLDFTYESNNFGVGLPPAGDNSARWHFEAPLLANPALRPVKADILAASTMFRSLLRIRHSSLLFRLRTAADVQRRLRFFNTGPAQVPGAIGMALWDFKDDDLDPDYDLIVVIFNGSRDKVEIGDGLFNGLSMELHPILAGSEDKIVKSARFFSSTGIFQVPGLTTAVFVARSVPGLVFNTVAINPY